MATGHNPLGINAYLNTRPAAEVRPAETEQQTDIRLLKEYYATGKKAFASCAEVLVRIYTRGDWKQDGLPWGKWAEQTFGLDRSHAYALVRTKNPATEALKAFYNEQSSQAPLASSPTVAASTYTSSTAPEPPKPKPQPQGPDSEEVVPAPRVRTEAGKPKRDLSIWKEIEERLLGVAANRVDTLNHECPNPVFHKKLQDQLSACFQTLAMWRESVK